MFYLCYNIIKFQSTPPRRRRLVLMLAAHFVTFISIHASAKEATESAMSQVAATMDFNPRLREGGDEVIDYVIKKHKDFNPRLREGGDHKTSLFSLSFTISIHASAKEATLPECEYLGSFYDFNPRLREGGDKETPHWITLDSDFNPRLREGGDHYLTFPETCIYNFNPRLREGGDLNRHTFEHYPSFQSTPPRRRRQVQHHKQ